MKLMKKISVEKIIILSFIFLIIPIFTNAIDLQRNLSVGSQGEDVKILQQFLNNYSDQTQISTFGAGSPGNETTYFGNLTKIAVQKFQNLNFQQILQPVNLIKGTGFVGPSTISFINSFQNITTNYTQNLKPAVFAVNEEVVYDGDTITIQGKNFSEENTIIMTFESRSKYKNIKSTDNGTKIEFELDSSVQKTFDDKLSNAEQKAVLSELPQTALAVSVITEDGQQSNFKTINFKLK
jgi:hypothetical protein